MWPTPPSPSPPTELLASSKLEKFLCRKIQTNIKIILLQVEFGYFMDPRNWIQLTGVISMKLWTFCVSKSAWPKIPSLHVPGNSNFLAVFAVVFVRSILAISVAITTPPPIYASQFVCAMKLPIAVGTIDWNHFISLMPWHDNLIFKVAEGRSARFGNRASEYS